MKEASLKPGTITQAQHPERAAVLLPLPLASAYDYKLAEALPRGTLVIAPLGARESLGVVWGQSEGAVSEKKLKEAVPLDGHPRLPEALCDFIDWVARYTLNPPGMVLALALRARSAFEAEVPRIGYVRGEATPARMTPARTRVLEVVADGLARSVPAIAEEANATSSVVRGLIEAGALAARTLARIPAAALSRSGA